MPIADPEADRAVHRLPDLATKQDIGALRQETKQEITTLRHEMAAIETRLLAEFAAVRREIAQSEVRLIGAIGVMLGLMLAVVKLT